MNGDKFQSLIKGTGEVLPYEAPLCYERVFDGAEFKFDSVNCKAGAEAIELEGKSYGFNCVKCTEHSYLAGLGGGALFYDAAAKRAALSFNGHIYCPDGCSSGGELAGWSAGFCFAPGVTITCEFGEKEITIGGIRYAAEHAKAGEELYLVSINADESHIIMLIDTARFLFYGFPGDGAAFEGYITVE